MHTHSMDDFRHEHLFLGVDHARNERKTWIVIALCGAMMVAEIGGGALRLDGTEHACSRSVTDCGARLAE
jgi:hypothetical protein